MKNLLLLIIFIPSFAFAVNEGDFSIEMTGFGISHHFKDRKDTIVQPKWSPFGEEPTTTTVSHDWNETNFGLGVSLVYHAERNFDVSLNVGSYNDSYFNQAKFAMVGFRKILGDRNSWNISAGPYFGYYDGSGFNGYGGMLVCRISYDRFGLNFTGFPPTSSDQNGFIAAFVTYRMLTF